MKSLSYLILLFLIFNFVSCQKNKTKTEKAVISDTIKINTPALNDSILLAKYNLNNYPKASFKIFYGQSYGFDSEEHRYGYVIMIIDSVVYLRYHSPKNESWNEVKYEKKVASVPNFFCSGRLLGNRIIGTVDQLNTGAF